MKKFLLFSLLSLFFITAFNNDAYAQRRKKKKKSSKTDQYFDESGFVNKLWYGGSFVLGFSGSGGTNQFAVGVTPMVGYKIVDDIISVGPRAGITYTAIKGRGTDLAIHKVNSASYILGAFTRVKVFQNFFTQFEYEYENTNATFIDQSGFLVVQNGEVLTARQVRDNVYIGAGYNSGGLWGYEILLLYNLNETDNTIDLPIDLRFGITYKF